MDARAKVAGARLVLAQLLIVVGYWQAGCTLAQMGTGSAGQCGDGVIEAPEQCDGSELSGQDCGSLGLPLGELACSAECTFDTTGCTCGNGLIEAPEECDGSELGGQDCASLGLPAGELACTAECTIDTTGCFCGNGVLDASEQCDGDALGGQDCVSLGLEPGTLQCSDSCAFDLSGCPGCGNGIKEVDEPCDGSDVGGLACEGGLACTDDCLIDASNCALPSSGDGSDGPLVVDAVHNLNLGAAPAYPVTAIGPDRAQVAEGPPALAPGDEVILINMQGSSQACGSAGAYELLEVASADASEVVFATDVKGGYGLGGANADLTGQKVLLQRVPHYSTVTITGTGALTVDAWDGSRGGLLVMRVSQQLTIEAGGAIDLAGLGYWGASGYSDDRYEQGRQGESLCGDPHAAISTSNYGGGGGGVYTDPGDGCGQGGGGAGYGQPGSWKPFCSECEGKGNTSPAHNGGSDYGTADLSRLLMGSGGGSGATDDDSGYSGDGGNGGGVALIFAAGATIAGTLTARGADGTNAPVDYSDSGNGGGGSGGAVYLLAGELAGTGSIAVEGGLGPAIQGPWNNAGGDGGVGRTRIDFHHADGHVFGSAGADDLLTTMASPEAGHSELYLQ